MSQLYKQKRPGKTDLLEYEEDLVKMMEFLKPKELIRYASRLKKTKYAYGNDNKLLQNAIRRLRSKNFSLREIREALETIAKVEYSKSWESNDESLEDAVWEITCSFEKIAYSRGYGAGKRWV